ncbi:MAG: YdiU family protein [Pseudomonadales bacterium]|nr:YdiU family protein [Pseudomonadales bacterium]
MTGKTVHRFDNRFLRAFAADPQTGNHPRQVRALYSRVKPEPVSNPALLAYSESLAELLGFSAEDCHSDWFVNVFSGNALMPGMQAWASCYGGHQFGHWAGQLGDGRAINLGELLTPGGQHWILQLKGAGPTPYSRGADGRAVLRSSLREFLCSEAMYHLGVPTTRALSLIVTGEDVVRDMFYDGNAEAEPGAVVCRAAPSFTRFGHFELLAARGQQAELQQLMDYTIATDCTGVLPSSGPYTRDDYLAWFQAVCERSLEMVVHWQRVGFVHGVMNTDNMSILGLTIDYGPYGWMEAYDPDWTPNTTDAQHRRYRFGQQARIVGWNLLQLANALNSVIDDAAGLEQVLSVCLNSLPSRLEAMQARKLGLGQFTDAGDSQALLPGLEAVFAMQEIDMTLFYRNLSRYDPAQPPAQLPALVSEAFYQPASSATLQALIEWEERYRAGILIEMRASGMNDEEYCAQRRTLMNQCNPLYVLRNYLAQEVIDQLREGDPSRLQAIAKVLRQPYTEQDNAEEFARRMPEWARHRPGCSMLSCSS